MDTESLSAYPGTGAWISSSDMPAFRSGAKPDGKRQAKAARRNTPD